MIAPFRGLRWLALLFPVAAALVAAPASAQGGRLFTLEARGGLAFPLGEFDPDVKTGYLVGVTGKISPIPFLSGYLGWEHARFGVEDDAGFAGVDTHVEDVGLRVGAELGVPLAGLMSGIAPYFQAGATFNRTRVDVSDDDSDTLGSQSDRTRGLELGTGARISLSRSLSLTPEVRYRRSDPDFPEDPVVGPVDDVTYLIASLGVDFHF